MASASKSASMYILQPQKPLNDEKQRRWRRKLEQIINHTLGAKEDLPNRIARINFEHFFFSQVGRNIFILPGS